MKKTGLVYDERYLLHHTASWHPETPDRLQAAYRGIEEAGLLPRLTLIKGRPAELKWIETVHSTDHITRLKQACSNGLTEFEHPDNQMCRETFDIALLAVGGILDAVRMVMEGTIDNAFCAVRPPGHHAEPDKAMGFCYFNNIAIAAKYLQHAWGVERIGIIDFDVHHGNGTQHVFERDRDVFFFSVHEHPSFAFPGTGREFEKGYDYGYGYTLNRPMLPGQGDREYQEVLERELMPAFDRFQPQVILVSAGFDGHVDDEMSDMRLTTEGFSWIMRKVVELADRHAQGRVVSILEGGYSLERLPELVRNHVRILLHDEAETPVE